MDWLKPPHPDADSTLGSIAYRTPVSSVLDGNDGNESAVFIAIFSPDDRQVFTVSHDYPVTLNDRHPRVWQQDAISRWSQVPIEGYVGHVHAAAFAMDGIRLLTASHDSPWQVQHRNSEGQWSHFLLEVSVGRIVDATISQDGLRALTRSVDGTMQLWQQDSDISWRYSSLESRSSGHFILSPDGRHVFSGIFRHLRPVRTGEIWQQDTMERWSLSSLGKHRYLIVDASFSVDGRRLLTRSRRNWHVWEQESEGTWSSTSIRRGGEPAFSPTARRSYQRFGNLAKHSVAFSPGAGRIITTLNDNTAQIWTEDTPGNWSLFRLLDHAAPVQAVAYSHNGRRTLTGAADGTVRVWEMDAEGPWMHNKINEQKGEIRNIIISQDGSRVLITSEEKGSVTRIWQQGEEGRWTYSRMQLHGESVLAATFSPTGLRVLASSNQSNNTETLTLWQESGEDRWSHTPLEIDGWSTTSRAKFAADGRRVLVGADNGAVRVWQQDSEGLWAYTPLPGHQGRIVTISFCPHDRRVLTGEQDGTVRVWRQVGEEDWAYDELTAARRLGWPATLKQAAFSPDGSRLLTSASSGSPLVWEEDPESGWVPTRLDQSPMNILMPNSYPRYRGHADFFPGGRRVLSAVGNRTARVWEQDTEGRWTDTELVGHQGQVTASTFSPDGRRVLTGSEDGTVRVWAKGAAGHWSHTILQSQKEPIHAALYFPDGRQVLTATRDGTVRVWSSRLLAGEIDWARSEPHSRAASVCMERIGTSLAEPPLDGSETMTTRYPLRTVTSADARRVPTVQDLVGQDVCAEILAPPPWWRALVFWR